MYQASVFVNEIDQQSIIPVLRSYLKFYTTMPISKLAAFMEIVRDRWREQCVSLACSVPTEFHTIKRN